MKSALIVRLRAVLEALVELNDGVGELDKVRTAQENPYRLRPSEPLNVLR